MFGWKVECFGVELVYCGVGFVVVDLLVLSIGLSRFLKFVECIVVVSIGGLLLFRMLVWMLCVCSVCSMVLFLLNVCRWWYLLSKCVLMLVFRFSL